jgi:hypothetical protein
MSINKVLQTLNSMSQVTNKTTKASKKHQEYIYIYTKQNHKMIEIHLILDAFITSRTYLVSSTDYINKHLKFTAFFMEKIA